MENLDHKIYDDTHQKLEKTIINELSSTMDTTLKDLVQHDNQNKTLFNTEEEIVIFKLTLEREIENFKIQSVDPYKVYNFLEYYSQENDIFKVGLELVRKKDKKKFMLNVNLLEIYKDFNNQYKNQKIDFKVIKEEKLKINFYIKIMESDLEFFKEIEDSDQEGVCRDYEASLVITPVEKTKEIKFYYDKYMAKYKFADLLSQIGSRIETVSIEKRTTSFLVKNINDQNVEDKCVEKIAKYVFNTNTSDKAAMQENLLIIIKEIELYLEEKQKLNHIIDCFENLLIKIFLYNDNFTFYESGIYVPLFTYDNCKKLRDKKTLDNIKNKFLEKIPEQVLNILKYYIIIFYKARKEFLEENVKKSEINSQFDINLNFKLNSLFYKLWKEKQNKILEIANKSSFDSEEEKMFEEFMMAIFLTIKYKYLQKEDNQICELDLAQNQIIDMMMAVITPLKVNKTITRINLQMNKLGNEAAWNLGRVFTYNNIIVDMDLSAYALDDQSLIALLKGLGTREESSIPLVRLNMANNQLSSTSGLPLAEIIVRSPKLKYLNISKTGIESGFNTFLLQYQILIKDKKTILSDLIALQIKLDPSSLLLLASILKMPKCTLTKLVLSDNRFTRIEASVFFKSIASNNSLKELILYKCDIDNYMADDIAYMLRNSRSLISVNLYENKIDDPEKLCEIISTLQGGFEEDKIINEELNKKHFIEVPHIFSNESHEKNTQSDLKIENSLKNFDISKNKCKKINENFIEALKGLSIEMLDFTQNLEHQESINKVKEVVKTLSQKMKIIF